MKKNKKYFKIDYYTNRLIKYLKIKPDGEFDTSEVLFKNTNKSNSILFGDVEGKENSF